MKIELIRGGRRHSTWFGVDQMIADLRTSYAASQPGDKLFVSDEMPKLIPLVRPTIRAGGPRIIESHND